jgi:uncharacterized membrane protein
MTKKLINYLSVFAVACAVFSPIFAPVSAYAAGPTVAATQVQDVADTVVTYKAQVTKVVNNGEQEVAGTGVSENDQTITAVILDGDEVGQTVTVDNTYVMLNVGDVFYLVHDTNPTDGTDYYSVSDPVRLPAVGIIFLIFLACVFVFGGWQGVRGLISLAGGLLLIFYVLLPGILAGYSPVLISIGVSALIVVVGSYITHGFNKTTSAAVIGMIVTIAITGLFAHFAVDYTKLSGFSNEESVYLNFSTNGTINFQGLLLGGILIGLLGVLYDIAISQAITVEELHRIGPHVPRWHIYRRAIRVGREHIGALINTLAIAYVGVSLPLLLLFYSSSTGWAMTANQEIFSTEIVRILIGSIGLVIAVPITTLIAAYIVVRKNKKDGRGKTPSQTDANVILMEEKALEHVGHQH